MKMKRELFVVSILVLTSAGQREEILCKARPGCQLATCAEGPFQQNLKANGSEYPITCIGFGDQEQASKEKYDELEKQLNSLRKGMRKLQKSNTEMMKENTILKREASKRTKTRDGVLKDFRDVKAQISQSKKDDRELTAEIIVIKNEMSQSSKRNQEMSAELAVMKGQILQLIKIQESSRVCEPPTQIIFGTLKCSADAYVVGTSCVVHCSNNHVPYSEGSYQLGGNAITCMENGEWSDDFPTCACPRCSTGDDCQWTTSWNELKKDIESDGGSSSLNYAGNRMTTRIKSGFHSWKWKHTCYCQDAKNNAHSAECQRSSRYGSCEHACAALIKKMVAKGLYEPPCDPEFMDRSC